MREKAYAAVSRIFERKKSQFVVFFVPALYNYIKSGRAEQAGFIEFIWLPLTYVRT